MLFTVSFLLLPYNGNAQTLNAQNDLFNVLQGTCSNYLDAVANDNTDSIATIQLQVISQPASGIATVNGNYLSYCPQPGFLGADKFIYSVTDSLTSDTATVFINVLTTNNQINPGDADQNGRVENFDVLALGLAFGTVGPSRLDSISNTSLAWAPLSFINSDPGATDCNGDGIVDAADADVINNNFLDTFQVSNPYEVDTSVCGINGIPFYIESLSGDSIMDGDTLKAIIKLGDSSVLNQAYGIAFTMEFDNRFIPGNLVQFQTDNSWLLQDESGLFFKKDFQLSGEIYIALTKTNHNPASGGGEIARVIIPIDDNIDGIPIGPGWHDLRLGLKKVRLISEFDIVREVCIEHPSIKVYKVITSLNQLNTAGFKVYPNPSNGSLIVEAPDILNIEITDMSGRKLLEVNPNGVNEAVLDLETFTSGIYIITVKTADAVFVNKIFIHQ